MVEHLAYNEKVNGSNPLFIKMKHYLWNMFSNLNNGQISKKKTILQKKTVICSKVLNILWDEGYILGYKIYNYDPRYFIVFLKYVKNKPCITYICAISKPSHKVYLSIKDIWKIKNDSGLNIFSTHKGIMSSRNCKRLNLGGEFLVHLN